MGNKRRILRNPKFKHLKERWFGSAAPPQEQVTQAPEVQEPTSNAELQEQLEAQPQEIEVQTSILDAAQEEFEEASLVEEAPKPKMTIKKSSPKKKTTTKKPRAKKTTTKRKSTKTKV